MTTIGTQVADRIVTIARGRGLSDIDIEVATGRTVADLAEAPESQKVQIIRALQSAAPLAPLPVTQSFQSGQSGRCLECGTALNYLSAGGYCFDCQS
jgi:hypothetical protein